MFHLKLENVKVISEQIEYQGATYVKSDGAASAGDIIRFEEDYSYMTKGGYYEVTRLDGVGDAQVIDDEGDEYDTLGDDFTVFKRVEAASAPAASDIVTHEGVKYRKVKRKAAAGDTAIITANTGTNGAGQHGFQVGDVVAYVRTSDKGNMYAETFGGGEMYFVSPDDYAVLEPVSSLPSILPDDYVIHSGKVYRKEAREASAGELVVVVDTAGHFIKLDEVVVAESAGRIRGKRAQFVDHRSIEEDTQFVNEKNYRVLVPVESVVLGGAEYTLEKRKPRAGESVLVVDAQAAAGRYDNGTIAKVDSVDGARDPYINYQITYASEYVVLIPKKTIDTSPQTYREVKRPARVGERIKVVAATLTGGKYRNGDVFTVKAVRNDSGGVIVDTPNSEAYISHKLGEYVVLEPVSNPQPKRLTVGDYAKIISGAGESHNYAANEIIRITTDDGSGRPYRGEKASDGTTGNWLYGSEIQPVTREDFEKARTEATQGDCLRVGEYTKVINKSGTACLSGFDIGSIAEVATIRKGHDRPLVLRSFNGVTGYAEHQNVVRATEAEVRTARHAIKVGEFADGGYAVIENATDDNSNTSAVHNNGLYVRVSVEPVGGYRGLKLTKADGEHVGYANADALRKITKEEFEAATAPTPKTPRLKVGEYARTLVEKDVPKGSIVKIVIDDRSKLPYKAYLLDDSDHDWYEEGELEPVSEAEVKWAAIGRKINEIRKGDLVKVVDPCGGRNTRGEFGTALLDGTAGSVQVGTDSNPRGIGGWNRVELVTPFEQRFDLKLSA